MSRKTMANAAADIQPLPRTTNFRAYLAGGGATAVLVGGAVLAFLSVAAFVAFNGLPLGANDASDARVQLVTSAPEAAADAAAPAARAVAETPATPSAAAVREIVASLPPGTVIGGTTPPGTGGPPDVDLPPGVTPQPGPIVFPPEGGTNPIGDTVRDVEGTTGSLGLDLPLSDLTDPVVDPVDDTVSDTLDGVGGLLGNDNLAGQVGALPDRLLNDVGNLAGHLLGGSN